MFVKTDCGGKRPVSRLSDRQHNVDHTLEAVSRLRKLLREHDRSGEPDTPFFAGIRSSLDDLDAYAERDESSAA
jgi:hypothetical protein